MGNITTPATKIKINTMEDVRQEMVELRRTNGITVHHGTARELPLGEVITYCFTHGYVDVLERHIGTIQHENLELGKRTRNLDQNMRWLSNLMPAQELGIEFSWRKEFDRMVRGVKAYDELIALHPENEDFPWHAECEVKKFCIWALINEVFDDRCDDWQLALLRDKIIALLGESSSWYFDSNLLGYWESDYDKGDEVRREKRIYLL